jgi:hypothetical protein
MDWIRIATISSRNMGLLSRIKISLAQGSLVIKRKFPIQCLRFGTNRLLHFYERMSFRNLLKTPSNPKKYTMPQRVILFEFEKGLGN